MGSLQSYRQRKAPVQLEPSGRMLRGLVLRWRLSLGSVALALRVPCSLLLLLCKGMCAFSSYITWPHNLSLSVAFLVALLSLCCRV